jgi:hypothetical protein
MNEILKIIFETNIKMDNNSSTDTISTTDTNECSSTASTVSSHSDIAVIVLGGPFTQALLYLVVLDDHLGRVGLTQFGVDMYLHEISKTIGDKTRTYYMSSEMVNAHPESHKEQRPLSKRLYLNALSCYMYVTNNREKCAVAVLVAAIIVNSLYERYVNNH